MALEAKRIAGALLGVLLVVTSALGDDVVRPEIVNGVYTSEYPTVGALLSGSSANTAEVECSGTLIGCRTFLTAAHCVCDSIGRRCVGTKSPDPTQFFVFLQHAGTIAVESVDVHPAYVFPVADLAVVHLAAPVTGITPTPINRDETPSFGTKGTIVGFGRSGLGNDDYGLKRAGKMKTSACEDTDPADPTWVCWTFEEPIGAPGNDSNICNADSGGPLFTEGDCGDQLTGVTSGSYDGECAPPDWPFDINVFNYRDWVVAHAGTDIDAAACGTLRQVGESGTDVDGFVGTLSPGTPEAVHTVVVPAGTSELRVTMNAIDEDGENFDLYVRHGAAPTTTVFDCADTATNQYADCVFTAPAAGTWHLMARRVVGSGVYQITATTIGAGAPASAGSGHCSDGSACSEDDACLRGRCVGAVAPDGTSCDDDLLCTATDTCSAGVCGGVAAPLAGCTDPGTRGAALSLQRDATDAARDQLTWRWSHGTIDAADLGTPTTVTPYTLCVFDESAGMPALRLESRVEPGIGWTAKGSGFRFRDKGGSQDGTTNITLRSGTGKGVIKVTGKGSLLDVPPLPLAVDPDVTVQLSTGAACWQARFDTAKKNDAERFQAKSE